MTGRGILLGHVAFLLVVATAFSILSGAPVQSFLAVAAVRGLYAFMHRY